RARTCIRIEACNGGLPRTNGLARDGLVRPPHPEGAAVPRERARPRGAVTPRGDARPEPALGKGIGAFLQIRPVFPAYISRDHPAWCNPWTCPSRPRALMPTRAGNVGNCILPKAASSMSP